MKKKIFSYLSIFRVIIAFMFRLWPRLENSFRDNYFSISRSIKISKYIFIFGFVTFSLLEASTYLANLSCEDLSEICEFYEFSSTLLGLSLFTSPHLPHVLDLTTLRTLQVYSATSFLFYVISWHLPLFQIRKFHVSAPVRSNCTIHSN